MTSVLRRYTRSTNTQRKEVHMKMGSEIGVSSHKPTNADSHQKLKETKKVEGRVGGGGFDFEFSI